MKILVRLPNWLGDMVMSVAFIHKLKELYPHDEISVISKKGIHELLHFFPVAEHQFIFSKKEYSGLKGLWNFGRKIRNVEKFDLFFSLPNSFSSAFMGYATGATKRVGFKQELRQILLTHSYNKVEGLHRVEEYGKLLELYLKLPVQELNVGLRHNYKKSDHVVININSEASSRRLTLLKATEIINSVINKCDNKIYLVGAPQEKAFVDEVYKNVIYKNNVENIAGKTSLNNLAEILATAKVVLTTDSGPAHLSNALGTKTIVLFGAGNEFNTAPYFKDLCKVIRLGILSCEPCEKNVCVRYGIPQCLEQLNSVFISEQVYLQLHGE